MNKLQNLQHTSVKGVSRAVHSGMTQWRTFLPAMISVGIDPEHGKVKFSAVGF